MRTDRLSSINRTVARGGDARGVLRVAAENRGVTLAELSRAIERSAGYVGRFVGRGVPAVLDEADRRDLARYLGIDDSLLA
ncbi:hypothetical protein ACVOMT_03315 [Sphingomonas panni]